MLLRICDLMAKDTFEKARNKDFDWSAIPKDKIDQFNQLDLESMSYLYPPNDSLGLWSKEFRFNLIDLVNFQAFTPHKVLLYSVDQDKFMILDEFLESISPKLLDAFKILVELDDELYDAELLCSVKSSISQ